MTTPPPIFIFGYPDPTVIGGALSEQWDTIKLWRAQGWPVTCIMVKATRRATHRLAALGAGLIECRQPDNLPNLPGLADGVLVDFCHHPFVRHWAPVAREVCPIVHVACMSTIYPVERAHYTRHGTFAAHVFQSLWQTAEHSADLARYGFQPRQAYYIPGAFDLARWPFRPRPDDRPFVVGRMSRPDPLKFSLDHWELYQRMPPGTRCRIMGWQARLSKRHGPPPDHCETLPAGAEAPGEFLAGLHLYVQSGQVPENWPRVGLEAMATGCPLIVDDSGGWRELVDHGVTGYRAVAPEEFGHYARILHRSHTKRLDLAHAARRRVAALTARQLLAPRWQQLFETIGPNRPANNAPALRIASKA